MFSLQHKIVEQYRTLTLWRKHTLKIDIFSEHTKYYTHSFETVFLKKYNIQI